MLQHLVITDVDAVQSYITSSVHLSTMVGASQIVAEADQKIAELAKAYDGANVLMNEGGMAILLFPGPGGKGCSGSRFGREAEDIYRDYSVSGHLTASGPVDVSTGSEDFGGAIKRAFNQLEERKRLGFSRGQLEDVPHSHRCASCGVEPATSMATIGRGDQADRRWMGESCNRKRAARPKWLEKLLDEVDVQADERAAWLSKQLPETFNELAGDNDLGLVLADADGVGQILPSLETREAWTTFSQGFSKMMASARASILPVFAPVLAHRDELPFQILYGGGDDVLLACRGDLALQAAYALASSSTGDQAWCPEGHRVGLSVSVVITRPGFPFRTSHRIAQRLLKEAKREARERGWHNRGQGGLDYALITEASGDADVILNDRQITSGDGKFTLKLSDRPYRVAENGPDSVGAFRDACQRLARRTDDNRSFPRSRLFMLRAMSSVGALLDGRATTRDGVAAETLQEAGESLRVEMDSWRDRTWRQSALRPDWEAIEELLGLSEGMLKVDDGHCETPVGDLADGIKLWGLR